MSNDKLYARQICFLFLAFALPVKLITMPALAAKSCQFWAFSCDILAKRNGLPDRNGTKF